MSLQSLFVYFSLNYTGYGGFDDYGGYNNYGYGNDGFDDRMRDGRGKIYIKDIVIFRWISVFALHALSGNIGDLYTKVNSGIFQCIPA